MNAARLRNRSQSPWPVVVGFVLYFISVAVSNVDRRNAAVPPAPTAPACSQCLTTWLSRRDPCDEIRERLPDHDPRIRMTSRSWDDHAYPRYESGLAHGYVDCEITPISTATSAEILRAGSFVLDEAQEKLDARTVSRQRALTSLTWQVPGYTAGSPDPVDGSLTLRVRRRWRARWLRIEVEERARPMWE